MKIYSDTLTTNDLYAALPADVSIAAICEIRSPRKRHRGWDWRQRDAVHGIPGVGIAAGKENE